MASGSQSSDSQPSSSQPSGPQPFGERLRLLPSIGRLLDDPGLERVQELYGRERVRVQARRELDGLRQRIDDTTLPEEIGRWVTDLPATIRAGLESGVGKRLRRVINATGIFVYTNLGRSPLPRPVVEEVLPLLCGYCDLEIDLEDGERSERNGRAAALLGALCGSEAALVANNNAAAMVLALSTLAAGRAVVVSRGELVEIGGSFRIPAILEAAGARLVEVGTTNRTRIDDYRQALDDATALLLKVHPSNYRIRGFTESTSVAELASLGAEAGVPVLVDEGSGLLRPSPRPQLADHDSIQTSIAAGCDLVCGSGDKLLGGPQAGLLVGREALIARCRRNPLYRALRPDRFTYAALEAILRRHLAGNEMPLDALWQTGSALEERLSRLAEQVGGRRIEASGYIGGGSAPDAAVPGPALELPGEDALLVPLRRVGNRTDASSPKSSGPGPDTKTESDLLPVVAYAREGSLILDLRTVDPGDDASLVRSIRRARQAITETRPPERESV